MVSYKVVYISKVAPFAVLIIFELHNTTGQQFLDTDYKCTGRCMSRLTRCRNKCKVNARTGMTRCINGRLPHRCKRCCESIIIEGNDIEEALDDIPNLSSNMKKTARKAFASLVSKSSSFPIDGCLCSEAMDTMVEATADVLGYNGGGQGCLLGEFPNENTAVITGLHDHCVCTKNDLLLALFGLDVGTGTCETFDDPV